MSLDLIWTHVFSFERELAGGRKFGYAGTQGPFVLSSAGGTPADRGRLELRWNQAPWLLSGVVNYVSSMNMIDHKGEMLIDLGDGTWATNTFQGGGLNYNPAFHQAGAVGRF